MRPTILSFSPNLPTVGTEALTSKLSGNGPSWPNFDQRTSLEPVRKKILLSATMANFAVADSSVMRVLSNSICRPRALSALTDVIEVAEIYAVWSKKSTLPLATVRYNRIVSAVVELPATTTQSISSSPPPRVTGAETGVGVLSAPVTLL